MSLSLRALTHEAKDYGMACARTVACGAFEGLGQKLNFI